MRGKPIFPGLLHALELWDNQPVSLVRGPCACVNCTFMGQSSQ